jgi:membrane protease YdiL (CAAX protease family)
VVAGGIAWALVRKRGETLGTVGSRADNAKSVVAFSLLLLAVLCRGFLSRLAAEHHATLTLAMCVSAVACVAGQELLFRAYLIPALERAGMTLWRAVFLSALLFSITGLGLGYGPTMGRFIMGFLLATVYAARRSLPELILARTAAVLMRYAEAFA